MRLLHTSDWHLGTSVEQVDCAEEHRRFLGWLVETIDERSIDVLVVAGDVFHYQNPGNADRKRFYNFLVDCARLNTLRKVVVVAGNHDSPSGLEAPKELLGALDVHVVGALPRDEEDWRDCLVEVENDAGDVEMVVAAVPYVQEARLGVSLSEDGESGLRRRFRQRFEELYTTLADEAEQRWPDAALVGTGHMTVYGDSDAKQEGDFHTAIHRTERPARDRPEPAAEGAQPHSVGMIEALDPALFDPRYDYVALGHIHRPMPVGGRRHIRYSGTPVATALDEDTPPRRVLAIDFDATNDEGRSPAIDSVEVPKWREILELRGTMEALKEQLGELERDAELPPAVYLTVEITSDDLMTDRIGPLQEAIEEAHPADWRPIIVDVHEERVDASEVDGKAREERPSVDLMKPREVFDAIYQRENPEAGEPPDALMKAFSDLAQEVIDTDSGRQTGENRTTSNEGET